MNLVQVDIRYLLVVLFLKFNKMNKKDKEQKKHLEAWVNKKGKGTSIAATGIGKTKMGLLAIEKALKKNNPDDKILIIVPTENLRDREWNDELKKWKMIKYKKQIEFQCIQTVYKYTNQHYRLVIVDEIHTTLSYEYRKFYENNTWDYIYGLTATAPENSEYKKFLATIAPIVRTTDINTALNLGLISNYKVFNLGVSFTPEEAKEYNKVDNLFIVATKHLGGSWHAFENATKWRNSKDKEEAKWANIFYIMMQKRKKICYNASNKISVIKEIVDKFNDRKALIFSENIIFAQELHKVLGDECVTFHSKMKNKERNQAIKSFGDGRTKKRIISSVKALNAGFNVPECSLGICAAGSSKALDNIQRTGRTLRLIEGKTAIYVNLYVRGSQEVKWVKKRTKDDYQTQWIDTVDDIKI